MMENTCNEKLKEESEKNKLLAIKKLRRTNPAKAKNILKKLKRKKASSKKKENAKNVNALRKTTDPQDIILEPVEYIEENVDERLVREFEDVCKRFQINTNKLEGSNEELKEKGENFGFENVYSISSSSFSSSDSDSTSGNEEGVSKEDKKKTGEKQSKKYMKLKSRPSVMKLKEFADKPEIVELWDTTAHDPFFYVWLKCLKNSVNVPQHWCVKRKYMHGKRGFEKQPYILPHYIEDTKISEIRQSIKEREEQKSLKQKMRDRVRPKLHVMDIDYQTLHDAFFKYATKPKLVKFGDLYYEGKEMELQTKKYRPGVISEKLRRALNVGENEPLPWINNMKKYGLPPSYPYIQIKGVNYFPNEGNAENTYSENGNVQYKYNTFDSAGNLVYAQYMSINSFGKYEENFYWGEIDMKDDEDSDEEHQEEKETEKKTLEGEEKTGKEEEIEMKEENVNLNAGAKEDMYKMTNMNGTYSVVTNSKMSGAFTPFMDGGLTSVDLTSFIPGYETPRYIDSGKWNAPNLKPYTVLQTEEVSIPQKSLFASNVKYKINPNQYSNANRSVNPSEGINTPYTPAGVSTPFTPYVNTPLEKEKTGAVSDSFNADIAHIRKELNKFEEISNKVNMTSAQVDPPKKTKKEEKKKKKKKYFKF